MFYFMAKFLLLLSLLPLLSFFGLSNLFRNWYRRPGVHTQEELDRANPRTCGCTGETNERGRIGQTELVRLVFGCLRSRNPISLPLLSPNYRHDLQGCWAGRLPGFWNDAPTEAYGKFLTLSPSLGTSSGAKTFTLVSALPTPIWRLHLPDHPHVRCSLNDDHIH